MVVRKLVKQEWWECGVCHMTTYGEWDAEAKLNDKPDKDVNWLPLCKVCTMEVKKNFIADEDNDEQSFLSS